MFKISLEGQVIFANILECLKNRMKYLKFSDFFKDIKKKKNVEHYIK